MPVLQIRRVSRKGGSSFSCLYGPDAFCQLLGRDVETVCKHVFGVRVGRLPKHARSLDEIRAHPLPSLAKSRLAANGSRHEKQLQSAGSTYFVIASGNFGKTCASVILHERLTRQIGSQRSHVMNPAIR